ncbi:MAG: 30S ribosomal protein S16 [Pirellulaceae bacterium]
MKKMGRTHRPFYRLCAVDSRAPRDGKVIEELGVYDPMVRETDARAILNGERIEYWMGVGAQPTPKAGVLIKKYGKGGSHLEQQQAAVERLKDKTPPPAPTPAPAPKAESKAEEPEVKAEEASSEGEAAPEGEAKSE